MKKFQNIMKNIVAKLNKALIILYFYNKPENISKIEKMSSVIF